MLNFAEDPTQGSLVVPEHPSLWQSLQHLRPQHEQPVRHSGANKNTTATPFPSRRHVPVPLCECFKLIWLFIKGIKLNNIVQTPCPVCAVRG